MPLDLSHNTCHGDDFNEVLYCTVKRRCKKNSPITAQPLSLYGSHSNRQSKSCQVIDFDLNRDENLGYSSAFTSNSHCYLFLNILHDHKSPRTRTFMSEAAMQQNVPNA